MGEFDRAIASARAAITKKGQAIVVSRVTVAAPPDPTKPWVPGAATTTSQNTFGVFLNYHRDERQGVLQGDQKVLIPALPTDPVVGGTITRGSETWKIVLVDPLQPNGQTVMYEVQVRQ